MEMMDWFGYIIVFSIGISAGTGAGMAIKTSSAKNPDGMNYALHPVEDENDALQRIRDAYSKMDATTTPDFVGFNEDGDLVQRVQTTNDGSKPTVAEEKNDYVKLFRFMNLNVLRVTVYEDTEQKKPIDEGMGIHNYLS